MTTEDKIKQLHPIVGETVKKVLEKLTERKVAALLFSGYRSFEEQTKLFALGRTVKNPDGVSAAKPMGVIITNSPAGQSWHNYGLAVDVVRVTAAGAPTWTLPFVEIGKAGKEMGMEWGGDWTFKDLPHLQMRFGYTIAQTQEIVKANGLPYLWDRIVEKQWRTQ